MLLRTNCGVELVRNDPITIGSNYCPERAKKFMESRTALFVQELIMKDCFAENVRRIQERAKNPTHYMGA